MGTQLSTGKTFYEKIWSNSMWIFPDTFAKYLRGVQFIKSIIQNHPASHNLHLACDYQ
jgi:hypothetical protein